MGNKNHGRGGFQHLDRGPQQWGEKFPLGANSMRRIPQGSVCNMGPDSSPRDLAGMQRKFMEQFGIDVSAGRGADNVPVQNLPVGGADHPHEPDFDVEVDLFLSTLKEEIKKNRRKQQLSRDSAISPPFRGGGGACGGNSGISVPTNAGGRSMAGIERMSRSGVATGYQDPMTMGNRMGMHNQMMNQMMMMRSRGSGSYGVSPNNMPSSGMMEEMRRQMADAGNSQSRGTTPIPTLPFYVNDNIMRQQEESGGRARGEDNDPALPEYGWGNK